MHNKLKKMDEYAEIREIFLGIGTSKYEHDVIGPIFSNEDDAKNGLNNAKNSKKNKVHHLKKILKMKSTVKSLKIMKNFSKKLMVTCIQMITHTSKKY